MSFYRTQAKKNKRKRYWVHPLIAMRSTKGQFARLLDKSHKQSLSLTVKIKLSVSNPLVDIMCALWEIFSYTGRSGTGRKGLGQVLVGDSARRAITELLCLAPNIAWLGSTKNQDSGQTDQGLTNSKCASVIVGQTCLVRVGVVNTLVKMVSCVN